jgi:hypothetical protein
MVRSRCPKGSRRNPKTQRCKKTVSARKDLGPCPEGKERNPATRRCRAKPEAKPRSKPRSKPEAKPRSKPKVLTTLPVDQEYNIYIICKSKAVFKEKVDMLATYKGTKIHRFYHIPAVFLKDTEANRNKTLKLNTRHNTLMKNRLRKLGCIFAHRNALRQIVKNQTDQNVILEEDANLDHVLPNPPKESTYLGGWIVPPQITLAGKKKVRIPHLKPGLNEIQYDRFKILMTHAYYLKTHENASDLLETIERPGKIKNYDVHLTNHRFLDKFYYPAIFVQGRHVSDIDGKVNKNDEHAKNYGLDSPS